MRHANPVCFTQAKGSQLVLLARLVDAAGRLIRPWQVAAIEFSIVPNGQCRTGAHGRDFDAGRRVLDVDDVVLPELATDTSWTIDAAGYNFRHEFDITDVIPTREITRHLGLHYRFTGTDRAKHLLRFDLKAAWMNG